MKKLGDTLIGIGVVAGGVLTVLFVLAIVAWPLWLVLILGYVAFKIFG